MNEKILVVDDEREIADLIELYLRNENFTVRKFYTAREALGCAAGEELDLAVLDLMMPGTDGFAVCRKIREAHSFPIIMLTARDGEIDKINGLAIGADDYVTKPFRPLELVARVKAQLRRAKRYSPAPQDRGGAVECAGFTIHAGAHECLLNGRPLALTPAEFTILLALCRRAGTVAGAEQLFHEMWDDEYYDKNSNTVAVHIRHVREKIIAAGGNPNVIKTVWGVGYKIEK
jgi:two-component system response regulator VanR